MARTGTPDRPSAQEIRTPRVVEAVEGVPSTYIGAETRSALVVRFAQGETACVRLSYNVERHRRRVENFHYNRPQSLPDIDD